jgi:hypothetical protein
MKSILLGSEHRARHGSFLSLSDLSKPAQVLDSASPEVEGIPTDEGAVSDEVLDSAAEDFGAALERSNGMGIALTFIEDGDYTFDSVDSLVRGFSGIDETGESDPSDDEETEYNELASAVLDSFVSLGADADQANSFLQSEDDVQGEALGSFLKHGMNEQVLDDATLICHHAVKGNLDSLDQHGVFDAAKEKKIRNGKVVWVKKKIGPKKRMSAKQKMALKKAQRKSGSAASKAKRAKSNRIAEKMGM